MKAHHIIGLSGGKDSTATLLLALDRLPKTIVRPVFVDTGNEHPATYAYLDYLEDRLGIAITRLTPDFAQRMADKRRFIARDQRTGRDKKTGVKLRWSNRRKREALATLHPTGNPFLDLCMTKGMFPSNRSRFCTEKLKRDVFVGFVDDLVQSCQRIIVWQGVRHEESEKRKNAKLFERMARGYYNFRPLIHWTEADVFGFIGSHGLDPNPLYKEMGFGRVSCAPCIYSNKKDLRKMLADDAIVDKIRRWEAKVSACSKTGQAAFFQGKELSGARLGEVSPLVFWERHRIDAIKHWSGKSGNFFAEDWDDFGESSCSSELGMCE
jgi:3'-phosphoadenosine 5'-phosphosulfate sulfotransferase (PAPS reductase)/FAD synthetase